ncbi:MAG: thiamine pyrophosphate-dependent enzyme [Caldisericia bacterium]|nr:thiamine pyrophosphate-dependent enzyme [Caldisericia bacterium]
MENLIAHPLRKYFRGEINYTNCSGCGNGIIAQAILWAIDDLGIDFDSFAFVSGIGCSGWIPSPSFNTDVLHVTHGRAVAFATGLKLAAPHMKIIICVGDGDTSAIGGNHFIHACRRNIDLTVICVNNLIYGMTGGQVAPSTPYGSKTTTTPFGSIERPFDLSQVAIAAGATMVARWTTFQARQLRKTIAKAILHPGFSFIEVISQCPVQYGKVIKKRNNAVDMLMDYKERSVNFKKAGELLENEREEKILVGEFVENRNVPELTQEVKRLRKEALRNVGNRD